LLNGVISATNEPLSFLSNMSVSVHPIDSSPGVSPP
jgi:hypothetical protein